MHHCTLLANPCKTNGKYLRFYVPSAEKVGKFVGKAGQMQVPTFPLGAFPGSIPDQGLVPGPVVEGRTWMTGVTGSGVRMWGARVHFSAHHQRAGRTLAPPCHGGNEADQLYVKSAHSTPVELIVTVRS